MASRSLAPFLRHLRDITRPAPAAGIGDGELVERFVRQRDEAAFELLVWRHQRMVLGVCRRVLLDTHEAEDAFQAAFLALVRKAESLRRHPCVAGWLHKVAYHIALRARKRAARQATVSLEENAREVEDDPVAAAERREVAAVLDEEMLRLPEKYRLPMVLCYLEGKTYAEAGRLLKMPLGTLSARLTRGRSLLRARLARRGISGALLAVLLGEQASSAAAPTLLVKTALALALDQSPSSSIAALADGALRSMQVGKVKLAAGLLAGFLLTGMGVFLSAALVSPAAVKETPPPAADNSKTARVDDYGDPLPQGVIRRIGTLRFRHGGHIIENLQLTPDGKTLLSSDYYGSRKVCVWELASGRLLRQLPGIYEQGTFTLSSDGKLAAIGHTKSVGLWDVASGKEIRRFALPRACGLAFSPDGKTLAGVSDTISDSIHLWDVASGKQTARWKLEPPGAAQLAFSPDGKTLIAGHYSPSRINLWDATTGKKRKTLEVEAGSAFGIAVSPDGALLATGSRKGGIPLWDVATGKLIHKLKAKGVKHTIAVAFAPDGKSLAAIELDTEDQEFLSLWDVNSGKEQSRVRTLRRFKSEDSRLSTVLFSRDGKTLILGCTGSEIRLWDVATGKEVGPSANTPGYVAHATIAPDGRTLAYIQQNAIRFWDMAANRERGTLTDLPHGAICIALSPDGRSVAAGSGEHAVGIWDMASRKLLHRLQWDKKDSPYSFWANAVAFSPNGKTLATADSKSAFIRLWDIATGKQMRRLTLSDPGEAENRWTEPAAVAFSPDGELLAASGRTWHGEGKVRIWQAATGKELPRLTAEMNSLSREFRPDSDDPFHRKIIFPRVVFSPDSRMLARNGWQKSISVWETATGGERLLLKGHEDSTVCVAFAPDGRTLASASWDETIRLWDLATGRELRKLTGHRGKATSLAFSVDGKTLVSTGDDTTILFWDVAAVTQSARPQADPPTPREWQALWDDLAKNDAARAYTAMVRMIADGRSTASALRDRLHPIHRVEADQLARLLRELDDEQFAVRDRAARELEKLADAIQPALKEAAARPGISLDRRRRLEAILAPLATISGERLRMSRAIEVLERLGNAEARELLRALAGGAPGALATTAARSALKRLAR